MARLDRISRCKGTSDVPHEEVEWITKWDTETSRWVTRDGKIEPCWMCDLSPDT